MCVCGGGRGVWRLEGLGCAIRGGFQTSAGGGGFRLN